MINFTYVALTLAFVLLCSSIKVLREYERAVVFTLGRFTSTKGPGLFLVIPVIQQIVKIDLRTIVLEIPPQDVISRDNVSVRVSAIVYFKVVDPAKAVIQVEDYFSAVGQLSQTTLRSVLGQHELDEMLAERTKLNSNIQQILKEHTDNWGIDISLVEIKQIDLNESMVRAIAKQAEAERERRAKVIHADGEFQAAAKLFDASEILSKNPQAIQLRYLQTLTGIAEEKNSTIVFPIPVELLKAFTGKDK